MPSALLTFDYLSEQFAWHRETDFDPRLFKFFNIRYIRAAKEGSIVQYMNRLTGIVSHDTIHTT